MKTFTVRQMDREPAGILDTCDREGAVRVRRRDGRTYTIRPEKSRSITSLPDFENRIRKIFPSDIPPKQAAIVDKLLAGE